MKAIQMEAPPLERRLVAILAADAEGYSRLMHGDKEATMVTLSARRAVVDDLIAQPDLAFWNSVKDSNRRDELQAYLTQHPNGHLAELARARLSSRYVTE
jgi:hypothetical protein